MVCPGPCSHSLALEYFESWPAKGRPCGRVISFGLQLSVPVFAEQCVFMALLGTLRGETNEDLWGEPHGKEAGCRALLKGLFQRAGLALPFGWRRWSRRGLSEGPG